MQFKIVDGVWPGVVRPLFTCARTRNAQLDRNMNILLLYIPAAARTELIYIYIYIFPTTMETQRSANFVRTFSKTHRV